MRLLYHRLVKVSGTRGDEVDDNDWDVRLACLGPNLHRTMMNVRIVVVVIVAGGADARGRKMGKIHLERVSILVFLRTGHAAMVKHIY